MTAAVLDMRPRHRAPRFSPVVGVKDDHPPEECAMCLGTADLAGSHRWRPPMRYNGPWLPWLTGGPR